MPEAGWLDDLGGLFSWFCQLWDRGKKPLAVTERQNAEFAQVTSVNVASRLASMSFSRNACSY